MSEVKQYAQRDIMALDETGNHYIRHVDHMTREKLHSKSDIAAELGWRDMQIAELKAQRDALAASFDELAASIGWSKEQCEQTGESPMDVAVSLVNLVSELENNDSKTAGHLEKLAGSMLNRTLDSGSKQAVAYAECADMVANFARQLRAGEPS